MPEEKREDDLLFGPLKEILESLGGGAIPTSLLSTELLGRMFEVHRALLQQTLGARSEGEGPAKHEREAVKALMQCSLDVMQSTREYRERVINAQSDFLERYAKLIEDALDTPGGRQGATSTASKKASRKDSGS